MSFKGLISHLEKEKHGVSIYPQNRNDYLTVRVADDDVWIGEMENSALAETRRKWYREHMHAHQQGYAINHSHNHSHGEK